MRFFFLMEYAAKRDSPCEKVVDAVVSGKKKYYTGSFDTPLTINVIINGLG
jgi:hypothetical protein